MGVSLSAELGEYNLVLLETSWGPRRGPAVLILVLILVQRRIVVGRQGIIASASRYPLVAPTLASGLVTDVANRSSDVTATVLATKQTSAEQVEHTISTLVTSPATHSRFAGTLAGLEITGVEGTNGTVNEAVARLASLRVIGCQVPVQGFAFVANTTSHATLALTQFSRWH